MNVAYLFIYLPTAEVFASLSKRSFSSSSFLVFTSSSGLGSIFLNEGMYRIKVLEAFVPVVLLPAISFVKTPVFAADVHVETTEESMSGELRSVVAKRMTSCLSSDIFTSQF